MLLLTLLIPLIILGVLLWAVNSIIPMDPWIKKIINVIAVVVVVIWLLETLVGGGGLGFGLGGLTRIGGCR